MATSTPDEKLSERELLVHLSRGNLMSLYLWSELADIMSEYDEDQTDDMMRKVNARLQALAYPTTLDQALEEFDAAKDDERGLWAGRYALFDDAGGDYVLYVHDDDASLLTPDGTLTEHTFSGGTLKIGDARYAFELAMILPLTDAQIDHPDFDPLAPTTPGQPRCEGTVTIRGEGQAQQTRKVRGKRECFTRAGVDWALDGDPPGQWGGVYQLICTTDEPWTKLPEADALTVGEAGGLLTVALHDDKRGARQGSQIRFANNALQCAFDAQGQTQLLGYFIRTTAGELPRFFGLLQTDGGDARSVTGYWTQAGMAALTPALKPDALKTKQVRGALNPAETELKDPPSTARTFKIDLKGLPTAGKAITNAKDVPPYDLYDLYELGEHGDGIVLLKGVELNDYAVILDLENMPSTSAFTASGVWRMVSDQDTSKLFVKLRRSSVTRDIDGKKTKVDVIWLDSSMGETQSAGWHYFAIEQVIAGTPAVPAVAAHDGKPAVPAQAAVAAKICRVWMDLQGVSRKPIEIAPTELPPIIIDRQYDAGVTASGGEPPLTWNIGTKPSFPELADLYVLPPGIKFDPRTQRFSGKVTDASLALRVYPVTLEASSDQREVMKPGLAVLNLRVEPEISSADARNISLTMGALITGAVGAVLAGLITVGVVVVQRMNRKAQVKKRYAAAQELVKTAKAIDIPTKQALVDSVVAAYTPGTDSGAAREAAKVAAQAIWETANSAVHEKERAKAKAEGLLDAGGLSPDKAMELRGEIKDLERQIEEGNDRRKDAERAKQAIDSSDKDGRRGNDAFENHIKGKV